MARPACIGACDDGAAARDGRRPPFLLAALALLLGLLAASALKTRDLATWAMEVCPVFAAVPVLWLTGRRFPLTPLAYALVLVQALGLVLGGTYGYARVPLGLQLADWLGLDRNPYDRIGHFVQGVVAAVLARELLVRGGHVGGRRMLPFVAVCIALAFGASYELVEWGAALALGPGADAFLGTQGDPWDAQSDMALALVGAVAAQLALARLHDRQIGRLAGRLPALAADEGKGPRHQPGHPLFPGANT